jgi:hypothetical protein
MTPFDGAALVAMLQAFYPAVTRAALERARRDRPAYFAGGVLFGTQGEKLRLGDGRVFDLAFDAWTARSRWQAIDVTAGGETEPQPFPLEPGALDPLDEDVVVIVSVEPVFEPLVSERLAELAGSDDGLFGARDTIAAAASPAALDWAFDTSAGLAEVTVVDELGAIDTLRPEGVAAASEGLGTSAGGAIDDYRDDGPDDIDVPDPGGPPDPEEPEPLPPQPPPQ